MRNLIFFVSTFGFGLITSIIKAQGPIYYCAENLRSDTFNVLKYTINLEVGNTSLQQLKGNTQVRFAPKINNRTFIRFDLLKFNIDSVKENNALLTYTYNDTILKVNFISPKNTIDTSIITVYYNGQPQLDGNGTGWGGFYFDNTQGAQYAYNLGVGFLAKPHNYGRIWFPCFDNFVERSKYEFNITTDTLRRAYCNGQLVSDIISSNKRTRKWMLNEEIPTYLACVAVANYTQVNWTVNTLNGLKPITLVAVAADTTAMKNGFVNLKNCIQGFENYYGPYRWNRFGYILVPFNGGAMEHATNIAYPRFAAGNLGYEDLMSHELSHHWWGDNITCETQEDMWLNEGFATFSAYMFFEWQYGKKTYLQKVKTEHDNLLHFLHKKEGFRPISGVPHALTYGDHVYKKGADVIHTLRGYMGDTAFFAAAKYTMQQNTFKSLNSIQFRNLLQASSGQNLSDFFNNWIMAPGWSHFAIDSVKYNQVSSTQVDAVVSLKQKLYGATVLHNNVPLELSFFKNDWSRQVQKVILSGGGNTFTLTLPFMPVYCALNYDSKINDASSHEVKTIKATGVNTYTLGKLYLQVMNKGADSSMLRVIHNYVKPDPFKFNPAGHRLSDQHYWRVEGILSPGFHATARFNYDGNKGTAGTYVYMDTLLTIVNADSISLFYRKDATEDWRLMNTVKSISSLRSGSLTLDTLRMGEYTFGNMGDTTLVRIKKNAEENETVRIYPNPARQKCTIELPGLKSSTFLLKFRDAEGKTLSTRRLSEKISTLDLSTFPKGIYLVIIENSSGEVQRQKLVIE